MGSLEEDSLILIGVELLIIRLAIYELAEEAPDPPLVYLCVVLSLEQDDFRRAVPAGDYMARELALSKLTVHF